MFHLVVVTKALRQRQPLLRKLDRRVPPAARQGHKGKAADGLERNQLIAYRACGLQALPVKRLGLRHVTRIPAQDRSNVERVGQAKGIAPGPVAPQGRLDQRTRTGVVAV